MDTLLCNVPLVTGFSHLWRIKAGMRNSSFSGDRRLPFFPPFYLTWTEISPSGTYRVKRPPIQDKSLRRCSECYGTMTGLRAPRRSFAYSCHIAKHFSCSKTWSSSSLLHCSFSGSCPGNCYWSKGQGSLLPGELETESSPGGVASRSHLYLYKQGHHGNNFQSRDSPNTGKQAPFIGVRDEYPGGDFNMIMRLRELLVSSGTSWFIWVRGLPQTFFYSSCSFFSKR